MNEDTFFQIRIADLLFDIACQYPSSKRYCRDYWASEKEEVSALIAIADTDIHNERERLLRKKHRDEQLEASTPDALEILVLCRFIAEQLPEQDRVLFHGSSLAIDGNGILFTAKSGTGKSTHTRLWRQVFGDRVTMVNDDKPFLHIRPDGTTVYGTPWRGKHRLGSNISAPLRAICIVCRAEENRIERISPREAFPMLLQQTYSPDAPERLLKTVSLVDMLSKTVPIYRLHCNMDPQAAEVAYEGINLAQKKAGTV